jgi:4-amino-4-deoxy-L-arabinose transferase-like glycosyltransferase
MSHSAGSRERRLVCGAVVLGLVLRIAYVVISRHQGLAGDQVGYDDQGRLFAAGHPFWAYEPYGIAHASAIKAPGYVLWIGVLYTVLGAHHAWVEAIQAIVCGTATIVLTWLLGRRLFGSRVGIAAAFVVAVYPLAWQYEVRLYSESLATPLTLACLYVLLERTPSRRRACALGVLIGVLMLVRPTSVCLLAGVAVAWWVAIGLRRAAVLTALTVAITALTIAPWTLRNAVVEHGFLPISLQDAAAYGTFNSQSADDPVWPYAWRPLPPAAVAIFDRRHPLPDLTWRARVNHIATAYIGAHPFSLAEAFFWNGLSRLWDVRRPGRALTEVRFEGRSRVLTIAGLTMYYVLAVLALCALWWMRRSRRQLVFALIAIALAASVVFTIDSGTRYRAPFEPMIALLACAAALGAARTPADAGAAGAAPGRDPAPAVA